MPALTLSLKPSTRSSEPLYVNISITQCAAGDEHDVRIHLSHAARGCSNDETSTQLPPALSALSTRQEQNMRILECTAIWDFLRSLWPVNMVLGWLWGACIVAWRTQGCGKREHGKQLHCTQFDICPCTLGDAFEPIVHKHDALTQTCDDHDRSASEQATLLADTAAPHPGDHVYLPPCHERPNRLRHAAEARITVPSIFVTQGAPAVGFPSRKQKAREFRSLPLTFLTHEGKTKLAEATMDTGADRNCIPLSLVKRLLPLFEPEAEGPEVKGIGGEQVTSMGKVSLPFRLACDKKGEYRDAIEFYVLADQQLKPHRVILSVACTEELRHLRREPCNFCDARIQTG